MIDRTLIFLCFQLSNSWTFDTGLLGFFGLFFFYFSQSQDNSLTFQYVSQATSAGTSSSGEEAVVCTEGTSIYFLTETFKAIS